MPCHDFRIQNCVGQNSKKPKKGNQGISNGGRPRTPHALRTGHGIDRTVMPHAKMQRPKRGKHIHAKDHLRAPLDHPAHYARTRGPQEDDQFISKYGSRIEPTQGQHVRNRSTYRRRRPHGSSSLARSILAQNTRRRSRDVPGRHRGTRFWARTHKEFWSHTFACSPD